MYLIFNKDLLILSAAWLLTIIMLILFIPKNKIREAQLAFLFMQLITWLFGHVVADFRLIEYPVEMFKNATKTSFTFEFFIFPSICAVFNTNYPAGKNYFKQFIYYFNFVSTMTIIEVLCEKYTNIIVYIHWTWYLSWITLFLTFFISRRYYTWYFRLKDTKG